MEPEKDNVEKNGGITASSTRSNSINRGINFSQTDTSYLKGLTLKVSLHGLSMVGIIGAWKHSCSIHVNVTKTNECTRILRGIQDIML